MSQPELKPCPFCGGDARAISMMDRWLVECDTAVGVCAARVGLFATEEEAIAAWNRRTPSDLDELIPAEVRLAIRLVCGALKRRIGHQPEFDTLNDWLDALPKTTKSEVSEDAKRG